MWNQELEGLTQISRIKCSLWSQHTNQHSPLHALHRKIFCSVKIFYFVIAVSGRAASPIINIINRLYIAICWINCSDVTALSASVMVLTKTPSSETDFICFSAHYYYRLQTCMQQRRKVFSAGERFRGLGKILIPRWNLIWNIDMDHSVSL